MPNTAPERLHIVIGVVVREDGHVLIARRPEGVHLAGLWEFPGGKVEPGETAREALARELQEELGIVVQAARPFTALTHDYPERNILLDAWWVSDFDGTPIATSGQPLQWVPLSRLAEFDFPPANRELLARLAATVPNP